MSLSEKLKEETKPYHQNVEKRLIKELKKISTLQQYALLLNKLYMFYEPIEVKIHEIIDDTLIPDINNRYHTKRLYNDLSAINNVCTITQKPDLFPISNSSYAIGVLYVIEGSTLGGQIITSMLEKKLQLKENDSCVTSYFNSYNKDTNLMWSNFKNYLFTSSKYIDEQQAVLGAKNTFKALENWLLIASV
ncbi:biliverdin-producing heme oxygenase [Tenacibaculum sp. IB213877]|uniref:biliverdin-producing heme oxygenase n=1 Tax=Tenacibaculum sp. IB213877 TaxID=3097351 RepID=UPI002A5A13E5|nr:biliverdin-producing heme oxygenase [Tenacibaculum sp. IB213877]MDY0780142.1 biliverdin-producing heme oxygenase [Tenacibaculum sp. IB213877]